jgi:hypothetical protein
MTTEKIADGAVTIDKIANDTTEPSHLYSWVNDTDVSFAALNQTL